MRRCRKKSMEGLEGMNVTGVLVSGVNLSNPLILMIGPMRSCRFYQRSKSYLRNA